MMRAMLRERLAGLTPDRWGGRELRRSMAASTRSLVSLPTPALSLSTAETVALDTPVWRATSEMVGRFPVIVGSAGVSVFRTGLNGVKPVRAAEHGSPS